jgi:tripartite-type tricarboxylate transporter receptor subunit TctC
MNGMRFIVVAALMLLSAAAHAQGYPNRPITIIVPFGAGSATDTITRVLAQHLSVALNQSVVVENKAGANGVIAASYVARSEPDGYTLFMSTNSPHSAAPFLMKNVPYEPVRDFAAVTRMGSYTLMLVTHPSIPAQTVRELIAHARTNPGKLSYGSGNTSGVVAGATLKHWAQIDIVHVPYKSAPPAVTDLLAGRIAMMFNDFTTSMPHVRAKTMRALAVTRIKRSSLFPELPTMDEAGVTGFDMDSWAGVFAPAKTPPEIVARLNAELRKIIDSDEVKTRLRNVGFEAFSSSASELDDFVKVQLDKWGKMVKDAGIQPQ